MSAPSAASAHAELARTAAQAHSLAESILGSGAIGDLSDEAVQQLLVTAVKLYAAKRQAGSDLVPFSEEVVTPTEAAIVTTSMLKAVNLELFELTLWNSWGRA